MKKLLLSVAVIGTSFWSLAQVSVQGVSPGSITGSYDFTWADPGGADWSCPDFNQPNTFEQAEIAVVDDGSAGDNAQGNPLSAEGCNALINGTEINGKIAMIYRGTCQFGTKALNAQNAGAVGVIIINRDEEAIGMAGGDDGLSVTIPVVMLALSDGQALIDAMEGGTVPVTVFMGNKQNLYNYDLGTTDDLVTISRFGSIPDFMANNGYNFDLGIQFTNYGSQSADAIVTVTLDGPSGNVHTSVVGPVTVASAEILPIFPGETYEFLAYNPGTWEAGDYTLTYSLAIDGQTDEDTGDNTFVSQFSVTTDGMLSLARYDSGSSGLAVNSFPSNATSDYKTCMMLDQDSYPTAYTGVEGFYFAPGMDLAAGNLTDEQIFLEVFEWNDAWTQIDPVNGWAASITFDNLNQIGFGEYYPTDNAENEQLIYAPLQSPILLADGQRYLMCLQTFNPEVYFGYDNGINYDGNFSQYLQPIAPINIDATWYSGWSSVNALSLGLKTTNNLGVDESFNVEGSAFPNPANNEVTISVAATGNATLTVTDISGRVASSQNLALTTGTSTVDVSNLESGVYVFNVVFENGQTSTFNVVKQ